MTFHTLIKNIKSCNLCAEYLPCEPRPIVQVHPKASLLIVGQAPSRKVHDSSIPWDDASGVRLLNWLGISREILYDDAKVAILPMGFCYPGKAASGDLPPRKECAPLWHAKIQQILKQVKLTLLIGNHAQQYYLKNNTEKNLTLTVKHFNKVLPHYFPLPHPSPLNNLWLSRNPWFQTDVLPSLRKKVSECLKQSKLK